MLRKARLLSLTNFKMKVQKVMAEKYPASFFEEYADEIFADTDPEIMQLIQDKSDENTVNILLSASPNDYVQFLCKKLNWEGSGSYFDETGKFQHLYGMTKKKWVQTVFPQNNYQYHFAVSDSKTDSEVMGLFEEKLFWNHLA